MTWLFPLYLLGGAAVIAPILMHLRRRPPQDRVEFSSLMFLDAQTPVPVSRRRLEDWLLLLLRCLALIVLALMFARPLWHAEAGAPLASRTATVLLVDQSASMHRGDLWRQARATVQETLAQASPEDRVAVVAFDAQPRVLWSFEQDQASAGGRGAALRQMLDAMSPGWQATDLGGVLVEAVAVFSRAQGLGGMKKKIVLVSDLQEGARLEGLRTLVWPENIALDVRRVDAPNLDNLTLSLAASVEASARLPEERPTVRLRISNARESKVADYKLDTDPPAAGYLPPGASRVVAVAAPAAGAGGITLSGDAWDFDNRVFTAPPQPQTVKIVFIGDEKTRGEASSPLFYLSRALQPTAGIVPELVVLPEASATLPADTRLVFLSGAQPRADLRGYLAAGGFVVSVITEKTTSQALAQLTGLPQVSLAAEASAGGDPASYAMLAEVRSSHPLLRPFADERLRDFTKLRFWRHRRLSVPQDAPLAVLARFDDGDPAILAQEQGRGTLILLTSGWHPADSQLALSTKFVPLLYGWLEAAGFRNEQAASLLVGDVLPTKDMTSITLPGGETRPVQPGGVIRAESPGLYLLRDSAQKVWQRAVNLAPEEGRVTLLDPAVLRGFGVRLEAATTTADAATQAGERERLALHEQEARQRAWLWLLGGLLALLAGETWLAGKTRKLLPQPVQSIP